MLLRDDIKFLHELSINVEHEYNRFLLENLFEAEYIVTSEIKSKLRQISLDFKNLELEKNKNKFINILIKHIKEFTGIKHIVFTISDKASSISILPVYTNTLLGLYNLPTTLKNIINNSPPEKLIINLENANQYIDSLYITYNKDAFKLFTSDELTAILLHEIGHIFNHTSNFPNIMSNIIKVISGSGIIYKVIQSIQHGVSKLYAFDLNYMSLSSLILFILASRTVRFIDHQSEFGADKFAAAYGYGKELSKALYKTKIISDSAEKLKPIWKKILEFIYYLFFPTSHPDDSTRICKLFNTMKNEYVNMYPDIKTQLLVVLKDVGCK